MKRFVKTRKWVNNIIKDNLRYITDIIFQLFNLYRYIRYELMGTLDTNKQDVNLERLFDIALLYEGYYSAPSQGTMDWDKFYEDSEKSQLINPMTKIG